MYKYWLALFAIVPFAHLEAHDLHSVLHPSNTVSSSVASQSPINLQALDEKTRSVIVNASKWPVGRTLTVCFYGGSAKLRVDIMSAAMKWISETDANLKMDFGSDPALRDCRATPGPTGRFEDIRIGFREKGLWSYIGVDSHAVSGPSMNFENWDNSQPYQAVLTWIVLHEFGHALGLHHEHQSPGAPCDAEFNTAKIKEAYGWGDIEIQTNINALKKNSSSYSYGAYDPKSIMMYSLREDFFVRPGSPCKVPQNASLSDEDKRGIGRAYPKAAQAIADRARGPSDLLALPDMPDDIRKRAELQKQLSENP